VGLDSRELHTTKRLLPLALSITQSALLDSQACKMLGAVHPVVCGDTDEKTKLALSTMLYVRSYITVDGDRSSQNAMMKIIGLRAGSCQ
jgi:hypothetical protein